MKIIRGGSGLGDSIYLRPLVDYFISTGEQVTVCSDYPDIFRNSGATVEPFRRENVNVLGHYVAGKQDTRTNQWQDACKSAGVPIDLPLHIDWTPAPGLRESWLNCSRGKPIILVHGGRSPMERKDGFGKELLPDQKAFQAALKAISESCMLVRIGKDEPGYDLLAHTDSRGRTAVSGLLDMASACDGIIAQPSFCIPLAEAFDKPLLCVWASHGMQSNVHPYVRAIRPEKVLSKPSSKHVVDDWNETAIATHTNVWLLTVLSKMQRTQVAA